MIVVINGAPQVGKDLVCSLTKEILGEKFSQFFSSIDYVKQVAIQCGWNGTKDLKSRRFLSDLKDILTNFNDSPFMDVISKCILATQLYDIQGINTKQYVIFVHIREPKEIDRFVNKTGAVTLVVRRAVAENATMSNHADANVLKYNYNYQINNNSTIADLKKEIENFLNWLGIEREQNEKERLD